ncbi:hypothetical protein A3A93_01745 [Candidatus Roizmanbacteria bacterium RIFCSPLOWO2_01_FULL_38_12]|uniref:Phage holin family protein n=1 Tax=Candidatus Roizmanbacteria bacterium RIFCSPLOWO2_01_FULL_38_12 TaxID=1802061 RepID=A0A1F7IYC0_9BACT|nr:MAG: hypothetical protein A2861_02255 [Candidatus Roizmanbacteria bacterium RIFCSPHIGHO2_01_FULL_38_15]OGK34530.1 MAG: hypothetical protein A3F59_04270 [Candidatus Roizmanbacteria bacterium RIFCSPHIGHO2_12_FULL_38_13]OGK48359.1 MAG: hypothetical protein A3A93_01745 [Candidatus Roizmanbacteria bacterium RIFCSPLOWO2_01_FULL_38_12]
MKIVVKLLVNSLAVAITAYLLQAGVTIDSFFTAVVVAVVLGVINTFIKPIIILLTLPINLITLGLFTFVINGLFILLVSSVVAGFDVRNFWWAVLFGIVLAIINSVLNMFSK